MFNEVFTLKGLNSVEIESVIEKMRVTHSPKAGIYNEGIITVFDTITGNTILSSWEWLLGAGNVALVATAFGDIFYWDGTNKTVNYFEVQYARKEFVDREVSWFLDDFLVIPAVVKDVLKKPQLDAVLNQHKFLKYGECYILEPWLILGGVDKPINYGVGEISVYLDLVSQSYNKS